MAHQKSPIVEAGLRDHEPSFEAPKRRLLIYNLRAVEFFQHPLFYSPLSLVGVPRKLVFESLAYRLRPIAMTDSDDCSIWATLKTLRQLEAMEESAIQSYEGRYRDWINLSEEDLRASWPNWEAEEPQTEQEHADFWGYGTPIQELWDRVFGGGPHADYKRVVRNFVQDASPAGRQSSDARYGKLIATISAVYPLIVDLHNDVLEVTSVTEDPSLGSFNVGR